MHIVSMEDLRTSRNVNRWLGLVSGIWVQAIAGNAFAYAKFSPALKFVMGYDQLELNSLGAAKDMGKTAGLLCGFLADMLPPHIILLIGGLVGFVGYGTLWLVLTGRIEPLPFWPMCLVMWLGGNSLAWLNTGVLVTCIRNFPHNRGPVTGVLKGYVGLSTAIFTTLCGALFTDESSTFVLVLALAPTVVVAIAIRFLRLIPPSNALEDVVSDVRSFCILNVLGVCLAIYLLCYTVTSNLMAFSPSLSRVFGAVPLLFLLSPVSIPLRQVWAKPGMSLIVMQKADEETRKPLLSHDSSEIDVEKPLSLPSPSRTGHQAPLQSDTVNHEGEGSSDTCTDMCIAPRIGQEHSILAAMGTYEFWLLFFSLLISIGSGSATINNLAQVGEAQGYNNASVFISLVSIWGFFGRIGSGSISEHYVRVAGVPRPFWMAMAVVMMILGYVLLGVAAPGSLYISSVIIGVCVGVYYTVSIPVVCEMFGVKHFGMLSNIFLLASPIGSLICSTIIGYIYDHVQLEQQEEQQQLLTKGEQQQCYGAHCFRLAFAVLSVFCGVALALNVLLLLRLRPLYQTLRAPRLH